MPRKRTLRAQLLRWVLVPLSVLLLVDAAGSYWFASRLSDRVYDGELMEIARELVLHVRRDAAQPTVDLEPDAERTLLLDQVDTVYYAIRGPGGALLAGSAALPLHDARTANATYNGTIAGAPVRIAEIRTANGAQAAVVVQVAETLRKRDMLTREILLDVIVPQLVLIVIAGVLCGWASPAALRRCARCSPPSRHARTWT